MGKTDMKAVVEMMGKLYNYIYGQYPEFKEINMAVTDMMLTYSEEAAIKTELKTKQEIAQKLIKEGWGFEKVAETVELDIDTIKSLYTGQTQSAAQV